MSMTITKIINLNVKFYLEKTFVKDLKIKNCVMYKILTLKVKNEF